MQLDIDTYEKIREALENFALYELMEESQDDEKLSLDEARKYYKRLKYNNES